MQIAHMCTLCISISLSNCTSNKSFDDEMRHFICSLHTHYTGGAINLLVLDLSSSSNNNKQNCTFDFPLGNLDIIAKGFNTSENLLHVHINHKHKEGVKGRRRVKFLTFVAE